MMGTDPFLWIGIGIADPILFPISILHSLSDHLPIPIRIGSPINDRHTTHHCIHTIDLCTFPTCTSLIKIYRGGFSYHNIYRELNMHLRIRTIVGTYDISILIYH